MPSPPKGFLTALQSFADGGSVSPASYLKNVRSRPEITPHLLKAVAQTESSFNPKAVSSTGALGLMQFLPSTAKDLAIDPLDPQQAVRGSRTYLSWLLDQTGNLPDALASYNLGIGAFKKLGRKNLPKETEDYVKKVLARLGKQEHAIPDSIVSQPHNPVDPIKPPEPEVSREELAAISPDASSALPVSTPAQPSPTETSPEPGASSPPSGAIPAGGGIGLGRRLSLPAAPDVPSLGDKDSPVEMVEKLLKDPLSLARGYRKGGRPRPIRSALARLIASRGM